jgi:sugar lactone lactonase YvrE
LEEIMSLAERFAVAALVMSVAASSIASSPPDQWIGSSLPGTFSSPTGLAYDASGGLYVTEWSAHRVTYINQSNDRRLVTDQIPSPSGVVVGRDGAVYISSYSEGVVYRLSSSGKPEAFVQGLRTPAGLSIGKDGNLLIADRGFNQILRADASGATRVIAKGLQTPVGAVEFSDGTLIVSNFSGGVVEIRPDGRQSELTRKLGAPAVGIVADRSDAVLVPDYGGTAVWRVTRSGSATRLIQNLHSPVAMARSTDGAEIAVGNWGDGTVRRYRQGGTQ